MLPSFLFFFFEPFSFSPPHPHPPPPPLDGRIRRLFACVPSLGRTDGWTDAATTSAEFYGNEAEVGKAIRSSGISRNELFLCSKVWTTTIERGEDAIRAQLDKSEWKN